MRGRNYRGGNSGGNGRGGRGGGRGRGNGGNRRGGGGGHGRNRRGGGGGGRRGGRHGGRAADSGNQRERIQVESGFLVLIDQFMLANPQFLDKLRDLIDEEPERKDALIQEYGGTVVEIAPATYRIDRDPYALRILVHPDGEAPDVEALVEDNLTEKGRVFIDTRCIAMVDRELLDDISLLERYQQLWLSGEDKACRDLLRDNGGAVRYGFQRFGDELSVHHMEDEDVVALWPDVTEAIDDLPSDEAADSEDASASAAA